MPHSSSSPEKPSWIRGRVRLNAAYYESVALVQELGLTTVYQEAACPNTGECWSKKHVTVMILGEICTRACRFCNVKTGKPTTVDLEEPEKIAQMTKALNLAHLVITSVDRDDLPDGGARHFANVIQSVRRLNPNVTI